MDAGDFSMPTKANRSSRIFLASTIDDGMFEAGVHVGRASITVDDLRRLLVNNEVFVMNHVLIDELNHLRRTLDLNIRKSIYLPDGDPKLVIGDRLIVLRMNEASSYCLFHAEQPREYDPCMM